MNDMKSVPLDMGALGDVFEDEDDPNDCADCGAPHWYNFMVPDDVWARICPIQPYEENLGGMLCAQCIDRRCVEAGITGVTGQFFFKGQAVDSRTSVQVEALRDVLGEVEVELAALTATPDDPDWTEAITNGNPADGECLTKAYNAARTALAGGPTPMCDDGLRDAMVGIARSRTDLTGAPNAD